MAWGMPSLRMDDLTKSVNGFIIVLKWYFMAISSSRKLLSIELLYSSKRFLAIWSSKTLSAYFSSLGFCHTDRANSFSCSIVTPKDSNSLTMHTQTACARFRRIHLVLVVTFPSDGSFALMDVFSTTCCLSTNGTILLSNQ